MFKYPKYSPPGCSILMTSKSPVIIIQWPLQRSTINLPLSLGPLMTSKTVFAWQKTRPKANLTSRNLSKHFYDMQINSRLFNIFWSKNRKSKWSAINPMISFNKLRLHTGSINFLASTIAKAKKHKIKLHQTCFGLPMLGKMLRGNINKPRRDLESFTLVKSFWHRNCSCLKCSFFVYKVNLFIYFPTMELSSI
jgi:hypothetical protein